ncbi:hypothetical protein ACX84U_24490, partial [Burkholderia pseudomallei]
MATARAERRSQATWRFFGAHRGDAHECEKASAQNGGFFLSAAANAMKGGSARRAADARRCLRHAAPGAGIIGRRG